MRKPFSKWADCGYCGEEKVIPPGTGQRLMPGKNVTVVMLTDGRRLAKGHKCTIPLVKPRKDESGVTIDGLLSDMGIVDAKSHHRLLAQTAIHGKTEGGRLRALERLAGPRSAPHISIEIRSEEVAKALAERVDGVLPGAGRVPKVEPKVQKDIVEPWVSEVLESTAEVDNPVPVQPEPEARDWEDLAPWTRQVLGPREPVWNAERIKAYRGSWAEEIYGSAPWNPWIRLAKARH